MPRLPLAPLAACAALLAGCGEDESNRSDGVAGTATESKAVKRAPTVRKGTRVKLVGSQFGRIVGDAKGQAFYFFAKEKTGRSECYGACAKAWPPVLTRGRPRAGRGARKRLLGTTRRRGGKVQVTYAGRPVYYYEHDAPGRVLCHDVNEFGGLWLVFRGTGKAVG